MHPNREKRAGPDNCKYQSSLFASSLVTTFALIVETIRKMSWRGASFLQFSFPRLSTELPGATNAASMVGWPAEFLLTLVSISPEEFEPITGAGVCQRIANWLSNGVSVLTKRTAKRTGPDNCKYESSLYANIVVTAFTPIVETNRKMSWRGPSFLFPVFFPQAAYFFGAHALNWRCPRYKSATVYSSYSWSLLSLAD